MNESLIPKAFRLFIALAIINIVAPVFVAQAQSGISLNVTDETLEVVLDAIEQQSKYLFLNNQVDMTRKVTVKLQNQPIENVLKQVFGGTPIKWEISGVNIYISKSEQKSPSSFISGVVLDETGMPVMGCGIIVKGTMRGASSDLDGKFEFELPEGAAVLEVTCLGYISQEIIIGDQRVFKIVLKEEPIMLDGTVVTALGIKRSEKALSYNVQQVNTEAILGNKDANFVNSLNGKVAGLVINSSSSGVGGASKVVMRGMKSISQSSNALYVIDGVPMYTSAAEGGKQFDSQGSTDPIADLNPEDIESISVLTGAAAAALYGSDAANGAIVVTTQKGVEGRIRVTATTSVELMNLFKMPEFQNRYGTGDLNSSIGSNVRSWGRLMNNANNPKYSPKDYFQTGITNTENVSLSTGTSKNQTYLSGSAIDSKGIVPNNGYHRYNFTFRNTTNFLNDKMHLDLGFSYILQRDRNMTNQGTYNNPLVGAYIFPRGNDWEDIRMFERYDPTRKLSTQYWPVGDAGMTMQNPYWINYRNLRENRKDRFMVNAALSYDILDWFNVVGRVRLDNSNNKYTEKFYATTYTQLTEGSENGLYGIEESNNRQFYADFLVNIDKRLNYDWTLKVNLGTSISDMYFDAMKNRGPIADGMITDEKPGLANVFNIQNLSNSKKTTRLQSGWREQTQSIFSSVEVGFKNTYFLTVTARNDWPSQLAGPHSNKKSFFYPSVGGSVVISELISHMPKNLEYIKIRGSYASVGTAFQRFIANPRYTWNASGLSWNTQTQYPMYDLKPELTNSWEVGLSMRFLQYFNMDLTYYHTNTLNQTFDPKVSTGSGSSKIFIQSGNVMNQGIEFTLGFSKIWKEKYTWNSNFTLSSNQNKIISLAKNVINHQTGEHFSVDVLDMNGIGQAHFLLKEGGTLGDLYSLRDFKYDSNGNIFVNEDGTITPENITDASRYVKLGSVLPKANLAWRNDFRFGGFNFGFLITARFGGIVYSSTQAILDYYGVSEASAAARDNGGVMINDGDMVDANKWFTSVGGPNPVPTMYTYSATNVRLQEASIGYTIPRKVLCNVCELNFSIVGRNLWMIYSAAPFDPEAIATTGNYYQGIDHFMMPSLRNFGFNIKLTF